jgi:uncharacterized membrane protein
VGILRAISDIQGGFNVHYGNGWMGGGMWMWPIGVLVIVLLVVLINKVSRK